MIAAQAKRVRLWLLQGLNMGYLDRTGVKN
jgi:hypothetical protein